MEIINSFTKERSKMREVTERDGRRAKGGGKGKGKKRKGKVKKKRTLN